ncbi:unnamed protein product [Lymnaea stagnalis]|uniref:Scavenger receptor class B member 1 n=1 Tax=Lymnaea stagnalis TaxID=6523 RepID=A0AAV2GZ23_LYMST
MSVKKLVFLLIVGVLLAAIGSIMFPVIDYVIKEEIKKKVVISNTSETYDVWQDIPIPVYMQFYIFNVLNSEEIQNGEKPAVEQLGPYTYIERRTKFDIVWNENGTVTYKQTRTFHFVPEMSAGNETDLITTINPIIAVLAQSLRWLPEIVKEVISRVLELTPNEDLFMTRPVKEVLWGYEDPSLTLLNSLLPTWFSRTVIGYFIRKNFTDDGVYTVYTGETDANLVGEIEKYNGDSSVNIWSTEWANMVNGSDGTLNPPFGFDEEYSHVFVSDICRSIRGKYKTDVTIPQGIKLRRFGGDQNDMKNATLNPDNIGFCTPNTSCLPTGLLNSTLCQEPVDGFALPIIFSFPHFLYADPEVQESVDGLEPNEWEHQTVIDAEPWTGFVLRVAKRLQINIFVEPIAGIKQTHNIRKLYFPVVWLNESSATDDKHADLLIDQLFTPLEITNIVKITLVCLGGVWVLVTSGLLIHGCWQNRGYNDDEDDETDGIRSPPRSHDPVTDPILPSSGSGNFSRIPGPSRGDSSVTSSTSGQRSSGMSKDQVVKNERTPILGSNLDV